MRQAICDLTVELIDFNLILKMHRNKILIVGLKDTDAGKTTLARAMLSYLREEGFDACGFKPMAGNNVWYDYDVISEALSEGRLYGKDAKFLRKASGGDVSEELINPVHRLWSEPPLINLNLPSSFPSIILDRVTLWSGEPRDILVENKTLSFNNEEEEKLLEKLHHRADDIYKIDDLESLNEITEKYYGQAIRSAYKKLLDRYDPIVIEGYGDVALPWSELDDLDLVVGVEPWHISIYNPDKYLNAVKFSIPTYSNEISTRRIKELVKPVKEVEFLPFRSDERVEMLKEKVPLILDI
ncbi:MAG: dithiobiotin synthetase [Candidatus Methanolliviera sp. GoM_asphalt]|nr:MAG: dithiobiotin synthetase [Candidatus Methanolliviera sp. GoM_asphalt]